MKGKKVTICLTMDRHNELTSLAAQAGTSIEVIAALSVGNGLDWVRKEYVPAARREHAAQRKAS